ncbi:MAG: WD40 repeat domain-containing protein [Candidatus Njordarchaeum guaymaensis]
MSLGAITKIYLLNEALLVTWFQSSRILVTWDGKLIQLWSPDGAEIFRYRFEKVFRISRNPVRDAIILGGTFSKKTNGFVINSSGDIIGTIDPLSEWSVDGEKILSLTIRKDKRALNLWSYGEFKVTKQNTVKINRQISDINWGFEANYVLGISYKDNKAYIIDLSTGKTKMDFKSKGELSSIVWSPYANLVAIGDKKGNLYVYRISFSSKGKLRKEELLKKKFDGAIGRIKWCSTSQLIFSANNSVNLLNIDTEEVLNLGPGTIFDTSFDVNYVAIGYDNVVRIHGAISGEQRKIIKLGGVVNDLEFSPNGNYLAIASSDFIVRIVSESEF